MRERERGEEGNVGKRDVAEERCRGRRRKGEGGDEEKEEENQRNSYL